MQHTQPWIVDGSQDFRGRIGGVVVQHQQLDRRSRRWPGRRRWPPRRYWWPRCGPGSAPRSIQRNSCARLGAADQPEIAQCHQHRQGRQGRARAGCPSSARVFKPPPRAPVRRTARREAREPAGRGRTAATSPARPRSTRRKRVRSRLIASSASASISPARHPAEASSSRRSACRRRLPAVFRTGSSPRAGSRSRTHTRSPTAPEAHRARCGRDARCPDAVQSVASAGR